MRKVHISLVGGQPIPVYIGIKDNGQASTVVLVCSNQSKDEAERIKAQFPKRKVRIVECHPVNLVEIEKMIIELRDEFSDYEKTINLTSGTKLWSLSFFRLFYPQENTHFIYVDQTCLITDILTKETHKFKIDTLTRFELYGTPLTSFRILEEYDDEDVMVMNEVEKIRNINSYEFYLLTKDFNEREYAKTAKGSSLKYSIIGRWAKISIKTENGVYSKELTSQHVFDILFNSGWFELKTAIELRKNSHIGNIWLNCEFKDTEGEPKNEIDIIAELDNRLVFVECKTMIHDTTDIDKFRSALRNFSGTSSTGVFVTNDNPSVRTQLRYDHAMEKCKDNNILTFNFSLWENNISEYPTLEKIVNDQILIQNKR